MQHFDLNEWKKYVDNKLDDNTAGLMEEHLPGCDSCLENYLLVLEDSSYHNAADVESKGITDKVMSTVKLMESKKRNKKKAISSGMLAYYAAAACLTLFITMSGGFDFIQNNATAAAKSITKSSEYAGRLFINGWSDRLADETSLIINKIENK